MDFIERLFNLTPDGGSGSSEAAFLIALILAVTLCVKLGHSDGLCSRSHDVLDGSGS